MAASLSVLVKHGEHANLDSFPLRFGFTLDSDRVCDLLLESKPSQDHRFDNRLIYQATLIHPLTDERYFGTFVLAKEGEKYTVVTAWRNEIDTEYYLSEVMKMLRHSGSLTTQDLLAFHPDYINGKLTTHAALVEALSENKSAQQVAQIEHDAQQAIEKLRRDNETLRLHNTTLQQQSEITQLKQALASKKWRQRIMLTFMTGLGLALLALGLPMLPSSSEQERSFEDWAPTEYISSTKAALEVGMTRVVCGQVVQIRQFAKGTYLNFDAPFPHTPFTAVVWHSDSAHVLKDLDDFNALSNQQVCVSGEVGDYQGQAQIIVSNPNQLLTAKRH